MNLSFKNFLLERYRSYPLLAIDVQPEYSSHANSIIGKFCSFLNTFKGPIICYYNGSEVGVEDTPQDLGSYYLENGLEEEVLEKITFKEKGYAFFRDWMDLGMERGDLITAIRYLVIHRIWDSKEVEDWSLVYGNRWEKVSSIVEGGSIFIPDINISDLKALGYCYLCGGAKNECLSEFRLILEAFNIPYKLLSNLVYE